MGLGQACCRRAESNGQLGFGIGAKSLDRGLGDVHTWPHSHYLMRLCNGMGGWVRLKYSLCRCGCDANHNLIEKETDILSLFILRDSSFPLRPLLLSCPLSGSQYVRSFSSYPALLRPPLPRDCRLSFPLPKLRRICIRCSL